MGEGFDKGTKKREGHKRQSAVLGPALTWMAGEVVGPRRWKRKVVGTWDLRMGKKDWKGEELAQN